MSITHTNDSDFEKNVLAADVPVLVDFWAEWCGPCKQIAPLLDELASEYGARLSIVKVDADENPEILTNYGVRSIPTLILFQDGQVAATKIGSVAKSELKEWLEGAL